MKRQAYTPEIKERAVRMLIEAAGDYLSTWSAIQAIASKIGCTPETLRSWHNEPPRDCRRPNILREYDNENTTLYS